MLRLHGGREGGKGGAEEDYVLGEVAIYSACSQVRRREEGGEEGREEGGKGREWQQGDWESRVEDRAVSQSIRLKR
jgi:hypothetical protein